MIPKALALAFALAGPDPRAFTGDAEVAAEPGDDPTSTAGTDSPDASAPAANPDAPSAAAATAANPKSPGSPTTTEVVSPSATSVDPRAAPIRSKPKHKIPHPPLVIAGGPVIGPHAFGNEECRTSEARCETHGSFLGLGIQAELRGRVYRILYVHARGLIVGNAAPQSRDPIYRGLAGVGVGLGVYARRVFGRAEYLFVDTFGSGRFTRPFGTGAVGNDDWRRHAGLFSVGARIPVHARTAIELWGGFMLGPKSVRTLPGSEPDRRILPTFLVGINVSYDVIPDRTHAAAAKRRPSRGRSR